MDKLTPRQKECLQLSATMTDKDIGRHLGISHHTVSLHVREAMARLGVTSRKAALRRLAEDPLCGPNAIPGSAEMRAPPPSLGAEEEGARTASLIGWGNAPPPPTGIRTRLLLILCFAILAAVVTVGLVSMVASAIGALEPHAPSNATLQE